MLLGWNLLIHRIFVKVLWLQEREVMMCREEIDRRDDKLRSDSLKQTCREWRYFKRFLISDVGFAPYINTSTFDLILDLSIQ